MLKINNAVQKTVKRHLLKNTVNAKYERCSNISTLSACALAIQASRIRDWQYYDVAITSFLTASFFTSTLEWFKNKKALIPIKKRAKSIKNASKI